MTEPTQYAGNPYENTGPWGVPPIPPPPPKKKRGWRQTAVPLTIVGALVVLIVVPSIVFSKQPIPVPKRVVPTATHVVPTPTPVPPTPTPMPPTPTSVVIVETPTPAPAQAAPAPYSAAGLYQDFVNSGMNLTAPVVDNEWSRYEWSPSYGAVSWKEIPGPCGGCGPNGYPSTIEIAVFQHQQSILDDAQQFANDGYTGKYVGGCVLFWKTGDGEPYDLQAYIDVMNTHCS